MPILQGSHPQRGGRVVGYRVEYEVVGRTIGFKAAFDDGGSSATRHEGQFDFDPGQLDAEAAVDAFMQNHIAKSDFDVAP